MLLHSTLTHDNFIHDLTSICWNDIYLSRTVDDMLDMFTSKLQATITKHLTLKTKYVRTKTLPPWLDQEVRDAIRQRESLKKSKQWDAYKQQRNFTTHLIQRKKKEHVAKLIATSNGKQTKQLWQALKKHNTSEYYSRVTSQ